MEIFCESCGKQINIPEEKIPAGRPFSLRCPACKQKIQVEAAGTPGKSTDIPATGPKSPGGTPAPAASGKDASGIPGTRANGLPGETDEDMQADQMTEGGYDASEKPFDFLEEEGLTAMVCENDPESVKKIREVLEIMEYSVTVPASVRDALKKMKYHVYDLILVNESFDGSDPDANGILIYLERQNMSIRRNIFVGLITKQFATRDNMAAFLKSVNITINQKDVPHIDRILKNAINDNELFFTVLKESMKKLGKI